MQSTSLNLLCLTRFSSWSTGPAVFLHNGSMVSVSTYATFLTSGLGTRSKSILSGKLLHHWVAIDQCFTWPCEVHFPWWCLALVTRSATLFTVNWHSPAKFSVYADSFLDSSWHSESWMSTCPHEDRVFFLNHSISLSNHWSVLIHVVGRPRKIRKDKPCILPIWQGTPISRNQTDARTRPLWLLTEDSL